MQASKISLIFVFLCSLLSVSHAEDTKESAEEIIKPLYDRLGGLMPISVVVSDFLDVLVVDEFLNTNPAINDARKRVPPAYLKYHVTAMMCEATGGPCKYQGRGMKETHAYLNITEAEWDRMMELFNGVLASHKVPEQESSELNAIMNSTKADIVMVENPQ